MERSDKLKFEFKSGDFLPANLIEETIFIHPEMNIRTFCPEKCADIANAKIAPLLARLNELEKALQVAIEALKNIASIRQPYREDETDFGITKESKEATEALAEIEKLLGD